MKQDAKEHYVNCTLTQLEKEDYLFPAWNILNFEHTNSLSSHTMYLRHGLLAMHATTMGGSIVFKQKKLFCLNIFLSKFWIVLVLLTNKRTSVLIHVWQKNGLTHFKENFFTGRWGRGVRSRSHKIKRNKKITSFNRVKIYKGHTGSSFSSSSSSFLGTSSPLSQTKI